MPITASLGALSYAKTSLDDYAHWYMQTSSNVTFSDFTFDDDGAFYVLGVPSAATTFQVVKFKEYPEFPFKIITYTYQGTSGVGPGHTNTTNVVPGAIKYNSVDGVLVIAGSATLKYFPTFPYNSHTTGISFELPKSLDITPVPSNFQYVDWGQGPPPLYTSYQDLAIDSTNGDLYFSGYGRNTTTGGGYEFKVRKKVNIDSTNINSSDVSTSAVIFPYSSGLPEQSCLVNLDSNQDAIFCGVAQATSTTGRKIVIRKVSKTPALVGSYYFLPTVWQRNLTLTQTLQSRGLGLDSSDNVYLIAADTSSLRSYIIKLNSVGVIQWQRRIDAVQLQNITVDASGDLYIVGQNTSNNLFIAKYNSSGTIQWQNKLAGVTYSGKTIYNDGTDLYIMGNVGANGFMFKVPNDGSIPGTGSYGIVGATLTYSIATQSTTSGTIIEAAATETNPLQAPLLNYVTNQLYSASIIDFVIGL